MKRGIHILSGIFLFVLSFTGCETKDKKSELVLTGQWKALWQTTMDGLENIDYTNLRMEGVVKFDENGQVLIEAFGHEGCVFSSDTLKNNLIWKLEGQTLRFIDQGDDSGLPYRIKSYNKDRLELVLMDDIFLTLERY